jgi:hypothetical protein
VQYHCHLSLAHCNITLQMHCNLISVSVHSHCHLTVISLLFRCNLFGISYSCLVLWFIAVF